jgi:hypothetical protein
MTLPHGPIYETTFFVDADRVDEFDEWLRRHVDQATLSNDVIACRAFEIADDEEGRAGRVCQYTLVEDAAVDSFLEGLGTDVEAEAEARFAVLFSSRLLREDKTVDMASEENPDCLNCGTRLRGQYCTICGQRSRSRLISLWELISDAFGDLFEIDSRLWKTLVPLLRRPGQLTADYLAGRRARFMPPFRSYLVLSLLFFLVAFFNPRESLSFLFEPEPEPTVEEQAEIEQHEQEILEKISDHAGLADEDAREAPQDEQEETADETTRVGLTINVDDMESCNVESSDLAFMPDWMKRRLTPERLKEVCERTQTAEGGNALARAMLDNLPAALIVLLPIMALVLLILYPLSRHYYVEHLLFFVHFHAFFFLLLTLQVLYTRLGNAVGLHEALVVLPVVASSFYVPVYLFKAMRTVYGQGWIVTFLKYVALVTAYGLGFSATMLGALAIAAFQI